MRRTKPALVRLSLLLAVGAVLVPALFAQTVTRSKFTPPVMPETRVHPVLYEATVSGSPTTVVFNYNSADRQMYDDGTHGDLVAGDGTWSIQFTPSEILSKNTAARVFRPIIGTCKPTPTSSFNVIGEVWTSAVGLPELRAIDATGQETDYVTNYVATKAQILTFDPKVWAQHFYLTHGDKYDFFNFVLIGGTVGNRSHFATKNTVQGIGVQLIDNDLQYGSAGKLQGITMFPISAFFDGGEQGFEHETGHQWIDFLSATAFAPGVPHWAKGNAAINVMGFS
ncbi:MAG: choice-of-anchor X domain-containing protein, partial [Chthoniobacterales bacterium]